MESQASARMPALSSFSCCPHARDNEQGTGNSSVAQEGTRLNEQKGKEVPLAVAVEDARTCPRPGRLTPGLGQLSQVPSGHMRVRGPGASRPGGGIFSGGQSPLGAVG